MGVFVGGFLNVAVRSELLVLAALPRFHRMVGSHPRNDIPRCDRRLPLVSTRMAAVPSAVKKGLADELITCITGITPHVHLPFPLEKRKD